MTALRREGADTVRRGRPWSPSLEDRVLLVAVHWRTNLTLRQLGWLLGVSKSAADRIIDRLGPLLALRPQRRFRKDTVLMVDGTLVPTRHHAVAVVVVGQPLPGNRNDCKAWELSGAKAAVGNTTVNADGGYRGTGLVIPHRRDRGQTELPAWRVL